MARYTVHRKDKNHDEIVKGLEAVGVPVQPLGGKGIPDLVVAKSGVFIFLEIKDSEKKPSERKLRASQVKFAEKFAGCPVYKVESLKQAYEVLGIKVKGTE